MSCADAAGLWFEKMIENIDLWSDLELIFGGFAFDAGGPISRWRARWGAPGRPLCGFHVLSCGGGLAATSFCKPEVTVVVPGG